MTRKHDKTGQGTGHDKGLVPVIFSAKFLPLSPLGKLIQA